MLQKTKAIALHYYKYSESSVIVKIFTANFGLQSFLVNGVRQTKAKTKLGVFQPFHTLDLEFYDNPNHSLKRIKEISIDQLFQNINSHIQRQLIAVFLAEVLMKILVENKPEDAIFDFTTETLTELNNSTSIPAWFLPNFLLHLSYFLGFYPSTENAHYAYFDLQDGHFTSSPPNHKHFISGNMLQQFSGLLQKNEDDFSAVKPTLLIPVILEYFKLHHHEIKNLNASLSIMESIME